MAFSFDRSDDFFAGERWPFEMAAHLGKPIEFGLDLFWCALVPLSSIGCPRKPRLNLADPRQGALSIRNRAQRIRNRGGWRVVCAPLPQLHLGDHGKHLIAEAAPVARGPLPEPVGQVVGHVVEREAGHGAGVRRDPRRVIPILMATFRIRLFTAVQLS